MNQPILQLSIPPLKEIQEDLIFRMTSPSTRTNRISNSKTARTQPLLDLTLSFQCSRTTTTTMTKTYTHLSNNNNNNNSSRISIRIRTNSLTINSNSKNLPHKATSSNSKANRLSKKKQKSLPSLQPLELTQIHLSPSRRIRFQEKIW